MDRDLFSKRLKRLRQSKKLSMQALADELGLKHKASISQFENQVNVPSSEILIALADYFDVSLDYLVGRSDDPARR